MLRQWVDSLQGHFAVHYAYMTGDRAEPSPVARGAGWTDYPSANPTWPSRIGSLIRRRGKALQEHYFWSGDFARRVARIAADVQPEVVVVDMARMFQYVPPGTDARIIVDLDDLLSLRYGRMLEQGKPPSAGRFASGGTRRIESAMRWFPGAGRGVLTAERARIAALENRIVREADAVVMTSPVEARQLRAETRCGPKIVGIPPGFEVMSAVRMQRSGGKATLGFFGNLDYGPNLESLEFLNTALAPMLESNPGIGLTIAGHCADPERLRKRLSRAVNFLGTVSRPQEFYESVDIVLAPIFSGTGIRTKVLEAFAYGLPVIGTTMAFEGIELPGLDRYQFETLDDLLVRVRDLLQNWGDTVRDVQGFQSELLAHHSSEQVRNLYLGICERAAPKAAMEQAA